MIFYHLLIPFLNPSQSLSSSVENPMIKEYKFMKSKDTQKNVPIVTIPFILAFFPHIKNTSPIIPTIPIQFAVQSLHEHTSPSTGRPCRRLLLVPVPVSPVYEPALRSRLDFV